MRDTVVANPKTNPLMVVVYINRKRKINQMLTNEGVQVTYLNSVIMPDPDSGGVGDEDEDGDQDEDED